ncbi:MAG: DUF5655 domain-containing protein [Anaerolineae bacterium]
MERDIALFFDRMPEALPLYLAFEDKIRARYPDVKIKIKKTQISFSNRYGFAYVWLPHRKMKGRPAVYMIVSFGAPYRIDSPHIVEAVEPYPNRWTHHVIIERLQDIDDQVMEWIDLSYHFSLTK